MVIHEPYIYTCSTSSNSPNWVYNTTSAPIPTVSYPIPMVCGSTSTQTFPAFSIPSQWTHRIFDGKYWHYYLQTSDEKDRIYMNNRIINQNYQIW